MSRFYANIQGNRGEATRMGTAKSGMVGHIRGWDIGCRVEMAADGDEDVCNVYLTGGSTGPRSERHLGTFRTDDAALPKDDVIAELLAALEELEQFMDHWLGHDGEASPMRQRARAAIAKARGVTIL